ncbi:MAG: fibronectin type III domain-containing protein [Coriobacteriia bacterium]|nr:fibronectin type III domain-containing protein [Coriobacteriia bacterium]
MKNSPKHFVALLSFVLALALAVPAGNAYAVSDIPARQEGNARAPQDGGMANDLAFTLQTLTAKASKKVKGVKVTSVGHTSVKITWKKSADATGYEVYRATAKKGKYTKVGTIQGGTKTSFTNKKLKTGKTYYYKVRTVSGAKKGAFSKVVAGKPVPKAPQIKTAATSHDVIKISWKPVAGATGYEVYRATSKTGKYTKAGVVQSGVKKSFTNKKLKPNKTYYFKVRAVCKGGKGAFCKPKSGKIYANRSQRPPAPSNPNYTYVWTDTSHYERVVVTPAWDEEVHVPAVVCDCGQVFLLSVPYNEFQEHMEAHYAVSELYGYYNTLVAVTIHHPAVYGEVWVVSGYWKLVKK